MSDAIEVTLSSGETIGVSPLTVGRLLAVIKAVSSELARSIILGQGEADRSLVDVVLEHPDRAADAVAAALERDPAAVRDMMPDDFVQLAFALVEVNADFFSRRIAPQIPGLIDRFASRLGSTSSSDSSTTDTPAGT